MSDSVSLSTAGKRQLHFAGVDQFGGAMALPAGVTVTFDDNTFATFTVDADGQGGTLVGVAVGATNMTVSDAGVSDVVAVSVGLPTLAAITVTADTEVAK